MRPGLPLSLAAVLLIAAPARAQDAPPARPPQAASPHAQEAAPARPPQTTPARAQGAPSPRAQEAAPPGAPGAAPAPPMVAAKLELRIEPGAERCPGEAYLRQEVARRIGYDPFAADAPGRYVGRVRVVIARTPQGLTATFDYDDAAGAHRWTRTYAVQGADRSACEVALSGVSIELRPELRVPDDAAATSSSAPAVSAPSAPSPDGLLPAQPPPQPPPPSQPPSPQPLPSDRSAPPPQASAARARVEVGVSALVGAGTAPRATAGGALHLGLSIAPVGHDRAGLSLAVEGRVDAPATDASGIRTQLMAGSFVACGHWALGPPPSMNVGALICAIATAGVLRATREGADALAANALYVGVGARLGLELRLTSFSAVRLQGEVLPTARAARTGPKGRGDSAGTDDVAGNAGVALVLSF